MNGSSSMHALTIAEAAWARIKRSALAPLFMLLAAPQMGCSMINEDGGPGGLLFVLTIVAAVVWTAEAAYSDQTGTHQG